MERIFHYYYFTVNLTIQIYSKNQINILKISSNISINNLIMIWIFNFDIFVVTLCFYNVKYFSTLLLKDIKSKIVRVEFLKDSQIWNLRLRPRISFYIWYAFSCCIILSQKNVQYILMYELYTPLSPIPI